VGDLLGDDRRSGGVDLRGRAFGRRHGRRLPAGPLREGPSCLERADLIVWHGLDLGLQALPAEADDRWVAAAYDAVVPAIAPERSVGIATAIADPDEESRRFGAFACSASGDSPIVFEDYRELLRSDQVDAVVIATPNFTHIDVMRDVFETDLHVLLEKPMCTTLKDCEEILSRAESHAGVVWIGLEYRYMPPITALLDELRAGAVGDLKMFSIREHRHPFLPKVGDWNRFSRNTGGTLVEKCCHFFDLMRLTLGDEPVRVMASRRLSHTRNP